MPPGTPHDSFDAEGVSRALGGPLGIAESVLPATIYVVVYTAAGKDAKTAAIVALAVGAVLAVARVVRRQDVRFALSGLAGVALSAFVVAKTGRAEDFFLPGLLLNAGYAAAYAVSNLVGWPLLGLVVSGLTQQDTAWRHKPELLRRYRRATWMWAGIFLLRLLVQLPMYLTHAAVLLGVTRVIMGVPLFVLGLWLSYLMLRDAGRSTGASSASNASA